MYHHERETLFFIKVLCIDHDSIMIEGSGQGPRIQHLAKYSRSVVPVLVSSSAVVESDLRKRKKGVELYKISTA